MAAMRPDDTTTKDAAHEPVTRRSHLVVLVSVVLIALVLGGYAFYDHQGDASPPVFCTAEGLIVGDGHHYHRDPDRGCEWVDENGIPLKSVLATYDPQGTVLDALTGGALRFEQRGHTWCAFVGQTPVLWPSGFSSDGRELRDPNGHTVAVTGETLSIGGGFRGPGTNGTCATAQDDLWLASGEIVERHHP
jgi:hypothetical protein